MTFLRDKIYDPECWSGRGLNLRPPAQQTGALPTELTGRQFMSQSKFCEGLDKRNLTLKIHSAFVPKYHLAFKLHDTCTKLI